MTVQWDTGALQRLEAKHKKNLQRAAYLVVGKAKEKLQTGQSYKRYKGASGVYYRGLDPSNPGEPPHKVTGQLQRSVTSQPSADGLNYLVGTNIPYGSFLEFGTSKMAPRPWLRPTLFENQTEIMRIVAGNA